MTHPQPPARLTSTAARDELDRAHAAVREELARATGTALALASTVATLIAVGLAAILAGQWSPSHLPVGLRLTWWAGLAATAGGLVQLGRVALPRLAPNQAGPPTNWGRIAAHTDTATLASALTALADDPTAHVEQLRALALIARAKWARLRHALLALAAGAALIALTALASACH